VKETAIGPLLLVPHYAAAVDSVLPSHSSIGNELESSSTGSVSRYSVATLKARRRFIYYIDLNIRSTFEILCKREFITRRRYPENGTEGLILGLNCTSYPCS
jgi:hypothetical protein